MYAMLLFPMSTYHHFPHPEIDINFTTRPNTHGRIANDINAHVSPVQIDVTQVEQDNVLLRAEASAGRAHNVIILE